MCPCPVCGSGDGLVFLSRKNMPVHQHILHRSEKEARAAARGDLSMTACPYCGFVYNAAFDPGLLAYGREYDNDQSLSPAFKVHLTDRADRVSKALSTDGPKVLEVGCGKGHFLKILGEMRPDLTGTGFDPSYIDEESALGGRLAFHRRFFNGEKEGLLADAVICRHVIEHIREPIGFLASLGAALSENPASALFLETPDVDWILKNRVIWDFFYEHCSLFSAGSLGFALGRCGLSVSAHEAVFGGQYLWMEAGRGGAENPARGGAETTLRLAEGFSEALPGILAEWAEKIEKHAKSGPVGLWGAGAKGVTFVNLIDPEGLLIDCLVDINPAKQGCFVAGTGHPIVDVATAARRGVRTLILMNPEYRAENLEIIRRAGLSIELA